MDQGDLERPTSVYVMRSGDLLKVGLAGNPAKRLAQLRNGSAVGVDLLASREFSTRISAQSIERSMHKHFSRRRRHGEWFTGAPEPVIAYLMGLPDPSLHIDSWHPDMPPEIARGDELERYMWHKKNGTVASRRMAAMFPA